MFSLGTAGLITPGAISLTVLLKVLVLIAKYTHSIFQSVRLKFHPRCLEKGKLKSTINSQSSKYLIRELEFVKVISEGLSTYLICKYYGGAHDKG